MPALAARAARARLDAGHGRVLHRRPGRRRLHRRSPARATGSSAASSPIRTRPRSSCSASTPALIDAHGAVSAEVARAMAEGALAHSPADARRRGDRHRRARAAAAPGKPVGTVWLALARRGAAERAPSGCSSTATARRCAGRRWRARWRPCSPPRERLRFRAAPPRRQPRGTTPRTPPPASAGRSGSPAARAAALGEEARCASFSTPSATTVMPSAARHADDGRGDRRPSRVGRQVAARSCGRSSACRSAARFR